MSTETILILAAPSRLPQLQGRPVSIVHQAYRIGKGPHLYRSGGAVPLRGGLMGLDCGGIEGRNEPGALCDEVLRECSQRGFQGVLCDFSPSREVFLQEFLRELDTRLERRGWRLYVPEWYAPWVRRGNILISSALSGGSFRHRLEQAGEDFGRERVTLALQRMAEDFFLPAPKGSGRALSREELGAMMERREPSVFFSNELCARYFTYMNSISDVHFVLFDDGDTLLKKIQLARELGLGSVLAAYEEAEEILDRLAPKSPRKV